MDITDGNLGGVGAQAEAMQQGAIFFAVADVGEVTALFDQG